MTAAAAARSGQCTGQRFNTQDFPPFTYLIDGAVSGPAVEVINQVCASAGIQCSFRLIVWSRAQKEVESGAADALFLIGWNEEREKWLHYSPPFVETSYGFFVRSDDPVQYRTLPDVSGFTVGVYGPSNTSKSLEGIREDMVRENLQPISIDMRPDDESGFHKLSLGRVQAVYSNYDVGMAMIAKLGLGNIRYAGAHKSLKYYVGFAKDRVDETLVERFNQAFGELHRNGTVGQVLAHYQMKAVPRQQWGER